MCMVNIDNGKIDVPEELPYFPQHQELADELRQVLKRLHSTPESGVHSSSNKQNHRQTWSPLALSVATAANDGNGGCQGVLERSEAYQRVASIAKRAGVLEEGQQVADIDKSAFVHHLDAHLENYVKVQRVNNAIREIFLNQFSHMFSVYEHFVIQPNQVGFCLIVLSDLN